MKKERTMGHKMRQRFPSILRLLGPPWVHGGEGGGDGGWVCYVFADGGEGGELGNPLLGVLGMLVEMGKVVFA